MFVSENSVNYIALQIADSFSSCQLTVVLEREKFFLEKCDVFISFLLLFLQVSALLDDFRKLFCKLLRLQLFEDDGWTMVFYLEH